MAHRGFTTEGLENSMAAFAAAVELGFTHVETDVHATADGVLMAFHDDTLDRVTDREGRIADLPHADVAAARIGGREPIPTLEEVLHTWPDLHLNIDVKADHAVGPTVEVIDRLGVHDRVCIASFDDRRRRAVLDGLSARVASSAGTATVRAFLLGHLLPGSRLVRRALTDVDLLQVPERAGRVRVVTPATVEAAHDAGVAVHVWTVNDRADMERLLDWGVDGIVSDRADVLRDVLAERGHWPG
ncbi:glycerophosphodiester phosphodiesterase [Nitriliruptoria bacterium AS10]|nr:glycerophosphodiester phosphodiesterase [Salsipaludibacter albus]MBY5161881.1 glycerophosphodiester phosphodiesterase [Salsipaludibacter albus]